MYQLGNGVNVNYVEAMKWYLLSAKQNNPYAQSNIGFLYIKGYGIEQDYEMEIIYRWIGLTNHENTPQLT